MTFEEFQATKRHVDDVGEAINCPTGDAQPGFVYADDLHIFDGKNGEYELIIHHDFYKSRDLAELERILFGYAEDQDFWP